MPAKTKKPARRKAPATTLQECRAGLDAADQAIERVTREAQLENRYSRLLIARWLCCARELYLIPNDGSRTAKRVKCNGAHDSGELAEFPGFEDFLASISWLPRRSAYAYLTLARNIDITAQTPLAQIEKMRKDRSLDHLDGKAWKALLTSKAPPEKSNGDKREQTEFAFVANALTDIRTYNERLIEARAKLSKSALETACARLHHDLCRLTGTDWLQGESGEESTEKFFKESPDVYKLGH